ncbi:hypothetical protein EUX98_g9394 [Antrodiella citrinella]|uniref:Uncharacterized protein n=1 Tax=Antrodiella citrinella TaxID=2447956 RepID=A0A4S4LZI4_9APHY|nr:hypothetical protein EUX98_g9394 [Antrodiella citrinella]
MWALRAGICRFVRKHIWSGLALRILMHETLCNDYLLAGGGLLAVTGASFNTLLRIDVSRSSAGNVDTRPVRVCAGTIIDTISALLTGLRRFQSASGHLESEADVLASGQHLLRVDIPAVVLKCARLGTSKVDLEQGKGKEPSYGKLLELSNSPTPSLSLPWSRSPDISNTSGAADSCGPIAGPSNAAPSSRTLDLHIDYDIIDLTHDTDDLPRCADASALSGPSSLASTSILNPIDLTLDQGVEAAVDCDNDDNDLD